MTGVLTILGFSLYDTVVVFDKVRENTKNLRAEPPDLRRGGEPRGQPDAGALDQHLDRGADPGRRDPLRRCGPARPGPLKDLALALFVGMAAGAYSSIFIATPLLAHMKSSETVSRSRRSGSRRGAATRPTATPPCRSFTEDLPIGRTPTRRRTAAGGRAGAAAVRRQPAAARRRTRPAADASHRRRAVR